MALVPPLSGWFLKKKNARVAPMVARDIKAYHVIKGIDSIAVIEFECECDTLLVYCALSD